jgi:hypothetical protein
MEHISCAVTQKHSTSFNKTTHPFRAIFGGKPRQIRIFAMGSNIQQKCSPSLRANRITHLALVNFSR